MLTTDKICCEYCDSDSEVAYFLMRLCVSHYTKRSVFLTANIIRSSIKISKVCIMITATLSKDEKLTDEDKKVLEEAKKPPITFDEDSPEMEKRSG